MFVITKLFNITYANKNEYEFILRSWVFDFMQSINQAWASMNISMIILLWIHCRCGKYKSIFIEISSTKSNWSSIKYIFDWRTWHVQTFTEIFLPNVLKKIRTWICCGVATSLLFEMNKSFWYWYAWFVTWHPHSFCHLWSSGWYGRFSGISIPASRKGSSAISISVSASSTIMY